jgi:VWFA-related protein
MFTQSTTGFSGALVLCGLALLWPLGAQQEQQPPVFRSGVELVMVDVQVIDRSGKPIPGLLADQFQVTIDGKRRKVISAHLIDAASGKRLAESSPGPDVTPPGRAFSPGNLYVLAVDQASFRATNAPSAMHAVNEFIKRLNPTDYMALISFPQPGMVIDPTRERAPLLEAVSRIVGFTNLPQRRQYNFSLADALDATSKDYEALKRVVDRNCVPSDMFCSRQVEMEMMETIGALEAQASRSLDGLRGVIQTVASLEGRKTLVIVSAGLPSGDRTGGRLYMRSHAIQAGNEAAAAGILLYTLHLNTSFLDAFSPQAPSASQSLMRETGVYARGLDLFNGAAGGTLMEVNTGPDFAIERVIREMSAYYLLGVQPEETDRDGRVHQIRVRVNHRGSSIRNRPSVVIPKTG